MFPVLENLLNPSAKKIRLVPAAELKQLKETILQFSPPTPLTLLPDGQKIVRQIRKETQLKNADNITRTKAYLDFYKECPEIEWSFLAHMVSRNAGYHMTDLKGELLPSLLHAEETYHFFLFLERANAIIFQDAYPQLLLYKKSLEEKKSLFHLLPAFGVSKVMSVLCERFWDQGNKTELTTALIINEQSMLQKRLLSTINGGHNLEKLLFFLQDRLEVTTVFFPYTKASLPKQPYSLAGTSISHFEETLNRITIGKKLYSILFKKKNIFNSALHFAKITPHSGSRCDYWPQSYVPNKAQKDKIYSPCLQEVWDRVDHSFSSSDWLTSKTINHLDALIDLPIPIRFDVTSKGKLLLKIATELKAFKT
ncbi:DUF2515 family protein [Bacillus sp. AK031]